MGSLKSFPVKDTFYAASQKNGITECFLWTTETTSRSKQINAVVSLVYAACELRFMKCLSTWLPRWPKQKFKGDFPDLTREDLKACIAYAADRERRFMTATLSECDGLSAKVAEESQYLVLSNEQLRFPKIFGTKSKNRSKFYIWTMRRTDSSVHSNYSE